MPHQTKMFIYRNYVSIVTYKTILFSSWKKIKEKITLNGLNVIALILE